MKKSISAIFLFIISGCYASFIAQQSYSIPAKVEPMVIDELLKVNGYAACSNAENCYFGKVIDSFIIKYDGSEFRIITSAVHISNREKVENELVGLDRAFARIKNIKKLCNENGITWGIKTKETHCVNS